jgi:uncharacterized protein (TIGR02145 family)
MKKIIIALGLAMMAIANIQAQDTMYVYQQDGLISKFAVSKVDSVIFYKPTANIIKSKVNDIDGNVYNVITIGGQLWMAENLKVTKLNDGTRIPLVTTSGIWVKLTTPGYCFYDNATTDSVYGALYNWYTVKTNKLCPTGWHVPSNADWATLTTYLGGKTVAGGKLKTTGLTFWNCPNKAATNEKGFSAVAGGYRYYGGNFVWRGEYGYWWCTNEYDAISAYQLLIMSGDSDTFSDNNDKDLGLSVRCLKD